VKNGAVGGALLGFALGASTRIRLFAATPVGVATFVAGKAVGPFYFGQKLKAFFVAGEKCIYLLLRQVIVEESAHD